GGGGDGGCEAELELAHESLVRAWKTMARWIDEGREELVLLTELGQAAALWERRGRRDDEVWRGQALHEVEGALARLGTQLPERAATFLAASRRVERRAHRRGRLVLGGAVAVLAAIALVSLGSRAVIADKEREARRRLAESQREGTRAAMLRGDLLEARAKVRGSLETEDSALGRALWWSLAKNPLVWKKRLGTWVYSVAFSPDGSRVAAGCYPAVWLIDVATLDVRVLHTEDKVQSVAFSPDGRTVAFGSANAQLGLWDPATDRLRLRAGHTSAVA